MNRKNPPYRIVVKINNSFQAACFAYIRVLPAIQRQRGDIHQNSDGLREMFGCLSASIEVVAGLADRS